MRVHSVIFGVVALASLCGLASAGTVTLDALSVYENQPGVNTSALHIELDISDIASDGTFSLTFRNGDKDDPSIGIITTIWFESGFADLLTTSPTVTLAGAPAPVSSGDDPFVNFAPDLVSPGKPVASLWTTSFLELKRVKPPEGIDGGLNSYDSVNDRTESLTATFVAANSSTTQTDIVNEIISGDGRIAMHVQSLGTNNEYSIGVTFAPLPAGAWMGLALLGGIGAVQVVRRRRRLTAI